PAVLPHPSLTHTNLPHPARHYHEPSDLLSLRRPGAFGRVRRVPFGLLPSVPNSPVPFPQSPMHPHRHRRAVLLIHLVQTHRRLHQIGPHAFVHQSPHSDVEVRESRLLARSRVFRVVRVADQPPIAVWPRRCHDPVVTGILPDHLLHQRMDHVA